MELIYVLTFTFNNFDFWNKFPKKSILPVEIRKKWTSPSNSSYNFLFKLTILFFGPNLPKKGSYFQFKTDKIDTTIKVCIFELVFVSISHWTNNLEFSDQTCPRRIFMVKNRKSEHHHWILHIQINLGTKFQLKQFWFFGPDLPQKGFSGLKQKKWTPSLNSAYSN